MENAILVRCQAVDPQQLGAARNLYRSWGAQAKANALSAAHPQLAMSMAGPGAIRVRFASEAKLQRLYELLLRVGRGRKGVLGSGPPCSRSRSSRRRT